MPLSCRPERRKPWDGQRAAKAPYFPDLFRIEWASALHLDAAFALAHQGVMRKTSDLAGISV